MRVVAVLGIVCLVLATGVSAMAGVLLEPTNAPDWVVSEWLNGDPGRLADQKGKVVLIDFFQLWCPGCNSFSIPLFEKWEEKYADRDDVVIFSIHTVFEGHELQTPDHLRNFVKEKRIEHPVGIDTYVTKDAEVPVTMDLYKTGGTPHIVIIDRHGKLRFSHFGRFDPGPVEAFIDRILTDRDGKTGWPSTRPSSKSKRGRKR